MWTAINESVSQDLFGVSVDLDNYRYEFSERIEDVGDYDGATYIGNQFMFHVLLLDPVDLSGLQGLDPAQLQEAMDRQFELSRAVGVLSSSYGSAAVIGDCISQINPDTGLLESGLFVNAQLDIDDPLLETLEYAINPPTAEDATAGDPPIVPVTTPVDYTMYPTAPEAGQNRAFRALYSRAFGVDPLVDEYSFETESEITGVGSYHGTTRRSQGFDANITRFESVEPSELGFDSEQCAQLIELGTTFAQVAGDINGEEFSGIVSNAAGTGHIGITAGDGVTVTLCEGGIIVWIPVTITTTDQDCVDACDAAKAAAYAAAQSMRDDADLTHDAAVFAAKAALTLAAAGIGTALTAALSACTAQYAALHITCMLLLASIWLSFAAVACFAAAAAVVAACYAAASAVATAAGLAAKAVYDAAKAAADAAKAASYAAADQIESDADAAYANCIAGCTTTVTILIPIFLCLFW